MHYLPIIGLEIHVEPTTQSKMFCGCSADIFGAEPNTHVCPVCYGLPGALPVPNRVAIEKTIQLGLALHGNIAEETHFDRKNYFYPDLPKGYQISQYKHPIVSGGQLMYRLDDGTEKEVEFERIHLEEDTGKLQHVQKGDDSYTLVDFNRSGMPLIEIVTAFPPQIHSAEEAKFFLRKLRQVLRYTGISEANMEEGTMRIEPNVSVAEITDDMLNNPAAIQGDLVSASDLKTDDVAMPSYKVELKNINSFKFAERAIAFDISRQIELLKQGKTPIQETRGWDENKNVTVSQRVKEEAHDYRYFPEPDIPPLHIDAEWKDVLAASLPETPEKIYAELSETFGLRHVDCETVLEKSDMLEYLRKAKEVLSGKDMHTFSVKIINQPELMGKEPRELFEQIQKEQEEIIRDDSVLFEVSEKVIGANPDKAEAYKNGNENLLQFFMGQIMKETKGKADPAEANRILKEMLSK